ANDARRAAIADVQRLLQHPDDLKKLPALRQEYLMRQQGNKAALSSAVAAQIEATRGGVEMLNTALAAIQALRSDFATIEALCTESASLIQSHDKIQLLSAVHGNLHSTLKDVENIVALPREAAAAQQLLDGEAPLLQVYQRLLVLEGTSIKAQAALESGTQVNLKEAKNLNSYFQRVRAALVKFEERLWSVVRAFLPLSRGNPGQLIDALQVIELQDAVDSALVAAGQVGHPLRKAWRRRCIGQLGMSVQERFAPLLARCSRLVMAGENTDAQVSAILADADAFLAQARRGGSECSERSRLPDVYEYVQVCFPPSYSVFEVVSAEYCTHLASMLDFIGLCAEQLANEDILRVVGWVGGAGDALCALGLPPGRASFPDAPGSGLGLLVEKYTDYSEPPKVTAEGRVWTPGPVDFFRILNEQLGVAAGVDDGPLLAATARAAMEAMASYQASQRAAVASGRLGLDLLCAAVNNNMRCYDESLQFAERLQKSLERRRRGQLDIESACRGFLGLAQEAVGMLMGLVFSDPGFVGLLLQLGCSTAWLAGTCTGSMLATLEDYLVDFSAMIQPALLPRVAEGMLEETVAHYSGAVLAGLTLAGDDEVAALRRDHGRILEFFGRHVKPAKAAAACQLIEELTEFLGADSLDGFVLSYGSIVSLAPGITPTLLGGLLAARVAAGTEFSKADAKEVLEECREVYASRQPQRPGAGPTGSSTTLRGSPVKAAGAREAALHAAVAAVRRRAADQAD
ncbi:hypothetical protein APUTEX25_002461, partial [Auxenochlorella protothecoides]